MLADFVATVVLSVLMIMKAMMVMVRPMAGAGFFGLNFGISASVMTLMLHIIFGAVLAGSMHGAPHGSLSNPGAEAAVNRGWRNV